MYQRHNALIISCFFNFLPLILLLSIFKSSKVLLLVSILAIAVTTYFFMGKIETVLDKLFVNVDEALQEKIMLFFNVACVLEVVIIGSLINA
ncbi:MAG: hypothetical protein DKM24_01010 [Candidatus Melainabacteria bacterium]|jgi:hypothetical protein|nr:MAG: hypothetical protein DKM24_01010 [Candidatus Melainabacteria bacterium]